MGGAQAHKIGEALAHQAELINLSHDAIITSDAGWIITSWNAGAEEIYGWSASEAVGQCSRDLLKTEAAVPLEERDEALRQAGRWDGELFQTRRDGQRIVVESRQILLRNGDGADGLLQVNRDITERKRFEDALKASEERFRLLFDEGPLGAAMTDNNLKILQANQALCGMLGYAKEELEGRSILDLTLPEDIDRCLDLARGIAEGSAAPHELEKRYVSKRGEVIWAHLTVGVIRHSDGRIIHLGLIENITEQKATEEALRQSEEHFRFMADSIPNLVWAASPEGEVIYNNARALGYMGTTPEGAQGDRWAHYIHPEDAGRAKDMWQEAVAEGKEYKAELRVRRASDGQYRWHLVHALPQRDGEGRVARWFGTATDIDDLRVTEAALRESEARYRALTDSVPEIIFMATGEGGNEFCNRRWYDYTGFTPEQTAGYRWADAMHPDDRDRAHAAWVECGRSGRNLDIEYRFRRADGVYRWFRGHAQPIRDSAGKVIKWFGICVDIDDQKRHEEVLRQTQKLESVGLLAGGIAHDFNNLLAVIIGNTSLVLPQVYGDDAERLQAVVHAGEKGSELTRQLLAYAGRGRLTLEDVNCSEIMRSIEDLMRFSIPKKVELRVALQDNLPAVRADGSQVQQVAMNLVINAAEAIGNKEAGVVSLSTSLRHLDPPEAASIQPTTGGERPAPGTYVCLEVTDSGTGMDASVRSRIFDPFFSTKFLGRGLGLSAVAGIVRSYGGFIEVESTPGQGSTFRVNLPAVNYPGVSEAAPKAEMVKLRQQAPAPDSGTVLVVDDDAAVRRFVSDALKHYGYDVLQAADGKSALSVFQKNAGRISAVFLDLIMPVLGGDDIIEDLHRLRPGVKIVLTSGYDVERAERLVGKGRFAAFLQKPYTAARLAEAVQKAMHG